MQGDDHIHRKFGLIGMDIPPFKGELVVAVFPGTGIQDNLSDKARKMGIPLWDFRERR